MTPERFQQIEELYHAAREGSAAERAALLSQADPELRQEVESLLAVQVTSGFMDRTPLENAAQLLQDLTATEWTAGARLGPYQIESKLGEGGMGQVFRAVDTRLGRAVAIKITHQQFSSRFEREARAISSLNHPNICTLYDVGPNYLVMELVEGETLAARLKQGPLPIEMVRYYGGQIAAALAEAHAKGIVHRDLKPGNIMIAKSTIKVLDFGLAKSGEDETLTTSRMVMGTPAYMSPEQREAKPTDARTDIYSFGCVLYEMSTGVRIGSQIGSKSGSGRRRLPSPKLEKIVSRCGKRTLETGGSRLPNWSRNWPGYLPLPAPGSGSSPVPQRSGQSLPAPGFISIARRNSQTRTPLSWPISSTTRAIPSSTTRFARAWQFNWNNRRR